MKSIGFAQWAIRIIIAISFFGILLVIFVPGFTTEARIASIGAAVQIIGVASTIPELAQRLMCSSAAGLVVWADTFYPLWKILSRMGIKINLGQLSAILSIIGIALIFVGLLLQYLAGYFQVS